LLSFVLVSSDQRSHVETYRDSSGYWMTTPPEPTALDKQGRTFVIGLLLDSVVGLEPTDTTLFHS